jgi:SulP family sulfate permease
MFNHLEKVRFRDGEALIRQGEVDTDIYIVEQGQVLTILELPDGRHTRLRHSGPGTIVGDMTHYLGGSRSASVIAAGDCTAYRLSSERIELIEQQQPHLALRLHKLLARYIARRLVDNNRILQQVIQ